MESEFAYAYPVGVAAQTSFGPESRDRADRRRSQREHYRAAAWLSPEAETRNGKQRQVFVNNLSLHGVGFTTSARLEFEAVHWIVVGAGALRASSRIRVVSCRPNPDGGYDVGGEFF